MSEAYKKKIFNTEKADVLDFESKKSKTASTCFYKVANHLELFKIGQSFYSDYEKGFKSFAISSTGYHTSQQQTILGIASFFDYNHNDLNILIISNNIFDGTYKEIIEASEYNEVHFDQPGYSCDVHSFYEHFDFLDLHTLVEKTKGEKITEHEKILKMLFKTYDIVLWDVPELNLIKESPSIYFPVISHFDCLSIVVSNNVSKTKDVEKISEFFTSYGLSLKGLLIDSVAIKESTEPNNEKSWVRRLFK